jgi:hypothetical protein
MIFWWLFTIMNEHKKAELKGNSEVEEVIENME